MSYARASMPFDTARLRSALRDYGLSHVEERVLGLTRPCVVAVTERARDEGNIPSGAAKVGGLPDLEPGTAWPSFRSVPMMFLGQVRLSEVAPFGRPLPQEGLLSFFYDSKGQHLGPAVGPGAVLFQPVSGLQRTFPPGALGVEPYRPCAVRYEAALPIPDPDSASPYMKVLGLEDHDA